MNCKLGYPSVIPMGATSLDAISVADIGGVVQYLFDHRDQFIHKTLTISGDKVTVKEMAASLTKHIPPFLFKDKQVSAQDVVRSDTHTRQGGRHFNSSFDRDNGRVRVPFPWRVYTSLVCLLYIAGPIGLGWSISLCFPVSLYYDGDVPTSSSNHDHFAKTCWNWSEHRRKTQLPTRLHINDQ